jgi:hypothetical protein
MTFARLASKRGVDEGADTHAAVHVIFSSSVPDGAVYARRTLIEEGTFTSRHETLYEKHIGPRVGQRLTRENPHLSEDETQALDSRGIIQPWVRVRAGDVLWSCLHTPVVQKNRGLEFKDPEDVSQRVLPLWDGALVTRVEYEGNEQQGIQVRVRLELEQKLTLGDAMFLRESYLGVLAEVLEDDEAAALDLSGELFASAEQGRRLGYTQPSLPAAPVAKSDRVAPMQVLARVGGSYSLISQQPLNRGPVAPAQLISTGHARWLLDRGLTNSLAELAGLKCDDLSARKAVEDFAAGRIEREQIPAPQASLSLWLVQAELMAMGLLVDNVQQDSPALRIRPASREDLLAVSSGLVRKPDTLNYRTYQAEPDGLFCPTIFSDKYAQFGHIELAAPVVPYWWRHGSPSVLEQLLPLTGDQIEDLVSYRRHVRLDGGQLSWRDDEQAVADPENWFTGGEAVRRLLDELAATQLPPGLPHGAGVLATDVLLVLPAPMRPLIQLDSGNFATSDLNDHYRRVINRNNRLRKLAELKAPPVILHEEKRLLQQTVDALLANEWLPGRSQVLGSQNRPLVSLAELLLGHMKVESKPVAWSAQARAAIDSDIAPGRVVVPRNIYEVLKMSGDVPVLLTLPDGAAFAALSPESGDALLLRIPRQTAEAVSLPADRDEFVSIHVPLRIPAIEEARRLHRGEAEYRERATPPSWLCPEDGAFPGGILSSIIRAALFNEPAPLNAWNVALLAGAWGIRREAAATVRVPIDD